MDWTDGFAVQKSGYVLPLAGPLALLKPHTEPTSPFFSNTDEDSQAIRQDVSSSVMDSQLYTAESIFIDRLALQLIQRQVT